MKLTPAELAAMHAKHQAAQDQRLAKMRDDPEFSRGGFPLSGNPATERAMHVDVGNGKPRCTVCGMGIFGDENWLPNLCGRTEDERHVYPNGEKSFMNRIQAAVAELIGEPID